MNSDGKVYLTREEQIFLMEMLEVDDPSKAIEEFAMLLRDEKADPSKLEDYIKKILKNMKAK